MGTSYFASAEERAAAVRLGEMERDKEAARIKDGRRKVAAKIVMAVVDKVVRDIIRPGPHPEERECYEMAGEVRALVPDLEALVKQVLDAEDGIK
jgi:hypothetical protein